MTDITASNVPVVGRSLWADALARLKANKAAMVSLIYLALMAIVTWELGRSAIVGKPMANLLIQDGPGANATVTVCHSRSRDLPGITRGADILIVAIGKPEFVTGDMVKPGAVVIDVGINRVDDESNPRGYRLCGDVKFAEAAEVASAITPVPGGVGPMTIAMLLRNTLQSVEQMND